MDTHRRRRAVLRRVASSACVDNQIEEDMSIADLSGLGAPESGRLFGLQPEPIATKGGANGGRTR
jgi:hypothetical protein